MARSIRAIRAQARQGALRPCGTRKNRKDMSNKRERQRIVGFRVNTTEGSKIDTASEREGCSVASFSRQAVLAAADGPSLQLANSHTIAVRDFTAEIQRIGLVTRKRVVTVEVGERIVDELRRLHLTVLRLHGIAHDIYGVAAICASSTKPVREGACNRRLSYREFSPHQDLPLDEFGGLEGMRRLFGCWATTIARDL